MIAIYARQSVERPDSISIAMQVEHCRRICPQSVPQQVYTDRGFSGTNTRRPALQQMLEAVEQGQIESVYVYKLDRISRSLCDFAAMMQEFRRRGVTLHSVRESFDTQTEIGGMLLNLLMMFAELEQKTIAGRVRDNYYARAVQQLALGGVPPYGYTAKPVTHGGHPTTMLEVQPEEAQQVQAFYTGYGVAGQNVEQLVQAANQAGSRTRQGARWSNSAVLRLLRSPVYVQGDLSCAVFLQRQGAVLTHALEAYCCGNGYLVYGSPSRRQGSKLVHLEGEHVAAGLHRGFIDGTLWRSVQERLNARGGSTNRGTGHTSWLQGLAVCGLCGTRCYARSNGKGAAYTYFVCRGKRQGICTGIAGLRTETVEQAVAPVLAEQAAAVLPYAQSAEPEPSAAAVALEKLEQRMRRLAAELGEPHAAVAFLREELQRLGTEHQRLEQELRQNVSEPPLEPSENWGIWWADASLEQRRQAAGLLLREVRLFPTYGEVYLQ